GLRREPDQNREQEEHDLVIAADERGQLRGVERRTDQPVRVHEALSRSRRRYEPDELAHERKLLLLDLETGWIELRLGLGLGRLLGVRRRFRLLRRLAPRWTRSFLDRCRQVPSI